MKYFDVKHPENKYQKIIDEITREFSFLKKNKIVDNDNLSVLPSIENEFGLDENNFIPEEVLNMEIHGSNQEEDIETEELIKLFEEGYSQKYLADFFGVKINKIRNIIKKLNLKKYGNCFVCGNIFKKSIPNQKYCSKCAEYKKLNFMKAKRYISIFIRIKHNEPWNLELYLYEVLKKKGFRFFKFYLNKLFNHFFIHEIQQRQFFYVINKEKDLLLKGNLEIKNNKFIKSRCLNCGEELENSISLVNIYLLGHNPFNFGETLNGNTAEPLDQLFCSNYCKLNYCSFNFKDNNQFNDIRENESSFYFRDDYYNDQNDW